MMPAETHVLAQLITWATAESSIRAVILTSSRARPDGPVDLFSDYDIILAVRDAEWFGRNDSWLVHYGEPMVRWGDQGTLLGLATYFRGVVYADHVKIDYSIWPQVLLERIAGLKTLPDQLDVGYRILLDKDGRTGSWKPPTYQAHVPTPPTEGEYRALIEEFWWDTTYVAKSLWRHDLVFAKWSLDHDAKLEALRRVLEWRIEIEHGWSVKPGVYGRGLQRLLSQDLWSELAATYTALERDVTWSALFSTVALFRRVASEVGAALGYAYPQLLDDWACAYLESLQSLPGAEAAQPGTEPSSPPSHYPSIADEPAG